jgi:O-antigen ligase
MSTPTKPSSARRQLLRSWPGRAVVILFVLGAAWTWWGEPPPLANSNAGGSVLEDARALVEDRASARAAAVAAAAVLDGPQGDFERRGAALRDLPADQRGQAAAALAADARLVAQVAQAAAAERDALRAYDAALMARTRDLGPLAESLRSATWPIVEHLKLYPPPLGTRGDWLAPDAEFFARRASILETGALEAQVAAAVEIGRSTYSVRQLRELDATYRSELERYAAGLQSSIAATTAPPGTARLILALLLTIVLVALLLGALGTLSGGAPDRWIVAGTVALLLWYVLPVPLAFGAGILLAVTIAARPGLAGLLPLAAIPLYYRPRTVGALSFPLNETLIGWIAFAMLLRVAWALGRGWRPPWRKIWAALWAERIVLGLAGALVAAGVISLLAPPLVDLRVATRELRRTIIEPALWALIVAGCLRRGWLRPGQMLWASILPAAVVASDGLVRFALGRGIWATTGVPRLIGILPSSTALGVYLAVALAGGLTLALAASSAERRAAWLLSVPLLLGVLLTFTRGAWIGVIVALAVVLIVQRSWRTIGGLIGAGGAALLGMALLEPTLLARVLRLGEGTGSARREIWAAALRAIQDSPLFGLGIDQFSHVDPARYAIPQIRFLTLAHPHNLLLDVWLQLGVLGLIVIVGLLLVALRRLWRARRTPVARAALAMLIDLVVHGMLDQTLLGGDLLYIWWMLVLIACYVTDYSKEAL